MRTWVIDLDGVVWLTGMPIPGSPEAIARLRAQGVRPLFVTNNASPRHAELLERLRRAGIPAEPDEVLGAAQAAATMLAPGQQALVIGEQGLREALEQRGVAVVEDGPADAVIVARTDAFSYALLQTATTLVREGARLIGTSEDATHPTPTGLVPGTGSLLAAVATASGREPEVAGKPHPPIVELIEDRVGRVEMVVGDRLSTDGLLAKALKAPFALVLSGVTTPDEVDASVGHDRCARDLWHLVTDGA